MQSSLPHIVIVGAGFGGVAATGRFVDVPIARLGSAISLKN